jgi:hypothetical protein
VVNDLYKGKWKQNILDTTLSPQSSSMEEAESSGIHAKGFSSGTSGVKASTIGAGTLGYASLVASCINRIH